MKFLNLRFSESLEKDFINSYFHSSLPQVRITLVTGISFYSLFAIFHSVAVKKGAEHIWFTNYSIVVFFLLMIFFFTFEGRYFKNLMQISVSIYILIMGIGITIMQFILPYKIYNISGYIALIGLVAYSYLFTKLRFIYSSITGWMILFLYAILSLSNKNLPPLQILINTLGLIITNLLGMFINYLMERDMRRDFLHAHIVESERAKSAKLQRMIEILPQSVAENIKQPESTKAKRFPDVTVLFADIVDFSKISTRINPTQLVGLLNEIFLVFDTLAQKYKLQKIKTIGDAYMVVGGLPNPRLDHAEAIAEMALDMQQIISRFRTQNGEPLSIRIGINTGPVVAGVVGINNFIYDVWGETVNTASFMESYGIAGEIQVTQATYNRLQSKFLFEERGEIQVKGKEMMFTYLLISRKAYAEGNKG